jgi:hypothetical protein
VVPEEASESIDVSKNTNRSPRNQSSQSVEPQPQRLVPGVCPCVGRHTTEPSPNTSCSPYPVLWDPDSNELAVEAVRKYPDRFATVGKIAERYPGLKLIFDHMGVPCRQ